MASVCLCVYLLIICLYLLPCDAVKDKKVYFVAGDLVYTYLSLGYRNPVTDVAFHPFENMVAFCSYGESHLIKIFTYDYKGNFDKFSALEVALVVNC